MRWSSRDKMVFFAYFLIVILSTIVIQQLKYSKPSLFLCGAPPPSIGRKQPDFQCHLIFILKKNQKNFQFSSLSSASSSSPISLNLVQLSIESQGEWGKVSKCRSRRQELDATLQCGHRYIAMGTSLHWNVESTLWCGHRYTAIWTTGHAYNILWPSLHYNVQLCKWVSEHCNVHTVGSVWCAGN